MPTRAEPKKASKSEKSSATARVARSRLWRWRRILFLVGLLVLGGFAAVGYALTRTPLPAEEPLLQTTFICAADVVQDCARQSSLAQLSGGEDRVNVTYGQLPPVLIQAVLSAEDRDFFAHAGVDPVGIARAAWTDVRAGGVVQGGSSITQQYVKNVFLTDERSVKRKLKEAVLAVKLEHELSKQQILERYLNTIYFGRGAYGVQAAARAYFGKDVADLDLAESAYLAGLIRSPESADPGRGPDDPTASDQRDRAYALRRSVLDAMVHERYISTDQRTQADGIPLEPPNVLPRTQGTNFGVVRDRQYGTDYFVEYVRRFLREEAGFTDAEIFGGGLRVYTTLDYDLQRVAYESVTGTLDQPDDPKGALVTVDASGRVMAMVGGTDWQSSKVNLAVGADGGGSGRQPGSSFKPFALAAALEDGISVRSMFSAPSQVVIPGADAGRSWIVSNYGLESFGNVDLVKGTEVSSNTVYAQLVDEIGPSAMANMAKRSGITSPLSPVHSLVLGSTEVSVLDMASAYSTFARQGEHVDPIVVTRVEDADGNVLRSYGPDRTRAMSPLTAQTVSWVLSKVIQSGTGKKAAISQPAAGKTGTTEDYRDAWFVGFTCKLSTAVWVGYDGASPDGSPRLMKNVRGGPVTGGSLPAEIWQRYMQTATGRYEACSFLAPSPFGGKVLHPELWTTTTSSTTSTTEKKDKKKPAKTTTTTEPEGTTTSSPAPSPTLVSPTSVAPSTTAAPLDSG